MTKFVIDNKEVSDPIEISNAFNKYFTEIGPKLASKTETLDESSQYTRFADLSFEVRELTLDEVLRLAE